MNMHKLKTKVSTGLSNQYAPVNSNILLTPFYNKGWTQSHYIGPGKNGIGKELITLSHPDYLYHNGDSLNIQCLNSNDGKGALVLMGGYGRIVCSNGLIIGDIQGARFVHRGQAIYKKISNQYDKIINHLNDMKIKVEHLKHARLNEEQQLNVVNNVLKAMFEKNTKLYSKRIVNAVSIERLLYKRREADHDTDAFTVLNVVQENIIRYGKAKVLLETTNNETGDKTRSYIGQGACELKAVKNVTLNKLISDEFMREVACA
jgi:hypothetical protein